MTTYNRICTKSMYNEDNSVCYLEKGRSYLTSEVKEGNVVVFSNVWFQVPVNEYFNEVCTKFTD